MDANNLIHQMELNAGRIRGLVNGVSAAQAVWKPTPDDWSILEVVNHLYDEERLDFRVRLDLILFHPEQEDWPPIDPPRWVVERRYNQRLLAPSLSEFSQRPPGLLEPGCAAWASWIGIPACHRPGASEFHAGDMLAAWANHDTLHIRQLVELQHAWIVQLARPV